MSAVIIEYYRGIYEPELRFNVAFSLTEYSALSPKQRELKRRFHFKEHNADRDDFQMFDYVILGLDKK